MGRHQQHPCRQRGSVTAEFAICLPAVLLVVLLVLAVAGISLAQLRSADAARAGARAAALGEEDTAITQIVTQRAGEDAWVEVQRSEQWVTVRVGSSVLAGGWGSWEVVAEYSAVPEPTGAQNQRGHVPPAQPPSPAFAAVRQQVFTGFGPAPPW